MKILGFWKEYRGPKLPFLLKTETTLLRSKPIDSKVIKYLEAGIWLYKLRTKFDCIISGEKIGTPYVYTDGEWLWTTEYIYYLNKYEINIPEEFIEKMIKTKFVVPTEQELGSDLISELVQKANLIGY